MPCNFDKKLREVSEKNSEFNPDPKKQLDYDKTLFDLQSFLAHKLDFFPQHGKLLDVGCAYATFSAYCADLGYVVFGLDTMPELSSRGWFRDKHMHFLDKNIETDEIGHDGFNLILFTEVIEHLNYNPVPVIKKLYDALDHGGIVICTTPMKELQGTYHPNEGRYAHYGHYRDIPLPWNGYEFEDKHQYFYCKSELTQLFHEVGFSVKQSYPIRHGTTHFILAQKI